MLSYKLTKLKAFFIIKFKKLLIFGLGTATLVLCHRCLKLNSSLTCD